jgi:predicted esterase
MHEHHLQVPKTARYFTTDARIEEATDLWIVCHGYAQLARRFLRHFESVADEHRLIVAPEGLSRFYLDVPGGYHGPESRIGATWMTREDRLAEIADQVTYLDMLVEELTRRRGSALPPVTALGFSQGVATVARWLSLGGSRVDRVVAWGGSIPTDVVVDGSGQLLKGASLTIVAGERDQFVTAERVNAELARLDAMGVTYNVLRFDGMHEMNDGVLRQIAGPVAAR